jgi:hypothetical protein
MLAAHTLDESKRIVAEAIRSAIAAGAEPKRMVELKGFIAETNKQP